MLILFAQIAVCIVLIGLVMLQSQNAGLGRSFGASTQYRSRKGMEKGLFIITIVVGVLFAATSLLNIFL